MTMRLWVGVSGGAAVDRTNVDLTSVDAVGAGDLAAALRATQPGVIGREAGSPVAQATRASVARVSGRFGV